MSQGSSFERRYNKKKSHKDCGNAQEELKLRQRRNCGSDTTLHM
jgi:hypothetical protein